MVFKSVWCACGASELKNIPCSRSTIPSCGKPCIKVCPDCNHPCSRVCHAGACVDTTHPCVRKCGRTRSCGHICQYKCHGVSECLEDEPCRQILKVVCNCGSKKKTIQCGTGKGAAAKAALFLLACDQSCEKKLIMERMKHALDIDPSNTFLPFAGWQENTVKLAISFPEVTQCTNFSW
jgi:transcriptional repressor NF-X1